MTPEIGSVKLKPSLPVVAGTLAILLVCLKSQGFVKTINRGSGIVVLLTEECNKSASSAVSEGQFMLIVNSDNSKVLSLSVELTQVLVSGLGIRWVFFKGILSY